jgi:hypothetical protein
MTDITHWIAMGLGVLLFAWMLIGFWRGLSLKPTDPASRPPDGSRMLPW